MQLTVKAATLIRFIYYVVIVVGALVAFYVAREPQVKIIKAPDDPIVCVGFYNLFSTNLVCGPDVQRLKRQLQQPQPYSPSITVR